MKYFLKIAVALSSVLFSFSAEAAPPETLSLSDLINHPERWPQTVTVKKNLNFANGKSVRKMQKVGVVDFDGKAVTLSFESDWNFTLSPKDCDLLQIANQAWTILTPDQRAIEAATLDQDPSLWPIKVKIPNELRMEGGGGIPAGAELDLISTEGQKVKLYSHQPATLITVSLMNTDLIERARRLVLIPANKRPSRVAYALKKIMVDSAGQPYTDPELENAQVIALYYGGAWCKWCREFSPTLVKFVNEKTPDNPYFKTVMVSSDQEDSTMLAYMKEKSMPWPAVPFHDLELSAFLRSYEKNVVPTLIICDRSGKLLATSLQKGPDGAEADTDAALQSLTKILDSGAAR